MGGSLAIACRQKFPKSQIIGISRNKRALAFARRKGWIDRATGRLEEGVAQADLVVLCTPVDTIPGYLKRIDRAARRGTFVTDVGSVKINLKKEIHSQSWKNIQFVSAHPMVGSHKQGIEAAAAGLYDKGLTFLIKPGIKNFRGYQTVKWFWRCLSLRVVEISSSRHDRIVSEISHLPHLLAVCLTLSSTRRSLAFASSGFRDVTRIAQGSPEIWAPILHLNRDEIRRAFNKALKYVTRISESDDSFRLRQLLRKAARKRAQI
jgi:prephenate dehydrogenase